MDETTKDEYRPADLREYLSVINRRKWTIILLALLVLGLALAYSFRQEPVYRSQARLLVKPIPAVGYYPSVSLETESQLVRSQPIAERAAEIMGESDPQALLAGLVVTPVPDSQVLEIRYSAQSASAAADGANAFAQGFIQYQNRQAMAQTEAGRQEAERQLEVVEEDLNKVLRAIERADQKNNEAALARLQVEETSLSTRLGVLQQQLQDVPLADSDADVAGELIEEAAPPQSPSSPNHLTAGAMGLFLGLALGLAVAFVKDRLDDRFRGRTDVERVIEAPVLSTIPKIREGKRPHQRLVALTEPQSGAAEAYRVLRTGVLFLKHKEGVQVVAVTSPREGEGKTMTAANLAVTVAQTGQKVALISADMRRPTVETYFGLDRSSTGLSLWLAGAQDASPDMTKTQAENVEVLQCGSIPHNPAELLSSARLPRLVEDLRKRFDFVIFDTPPVLPVADVSTIAPVIDGALLVLDAGATRRSHASRAREDLERVGTRIVGTILNNYDPGDSSYYYYTPHRYESIESPSLNGRSKAPARRKLFGRR